MTADIGAYAVEYAAHNWAVFPLNGKVPAIAGGHGVLDATTDIDTITNWWSGRYAGSNIGGRVPESMIVIDVDPRHGGLESVAALENTYSPLPETLTTISGRGDGGRHMFYRRPFGSLSARRLGPGIDLKTSKGYVVLAPSIHPDSGKPYQRVEKPVATPPVWLIQLLRPAQVQPHRANPALRNGESRYTLHCLVQRINAATEGRRNTTTFGAMRDAHTEGNLAEWADELAAAARGIGLPDFEVQTILRSAGRAA